MMIMTKKDLYTHFDLLGRHQANNAGIALAAIHELTRLGWNISEDSIRQGLASVRLPARIEVVARSLL